MSACKELAQSLIGLKLRPGNRYHKSIGSLAFLIVILAFSAILPSTVQAQQPCAGAPASSNTSSTINPVCPSQNFFLLLTETYTETDITYQWQSSPDGMAWTNIGGATNGTVMVSQTAATWYRCIVTCDNTNQSVASTPLLVTMNTNSCQCAGYCPALSAGAACITNVSFNTINNSSGCSPGNYSLHTATTQVQAGLIYPLSVTTDASAIVSAWIDFNRNEVFDSLEWAQVFTSGTTGTVFISIPIDASTGLTRLRIRTRFAGGVNGPTNPCTLFDSGENEDYCIIIDPPANCSGMPTGGTTVSSVSEICPGENFTLSLTGATVGSGITYQWQSSPNNMNYTDISGATTPQLTTSQSSSTWYKCIITCSFSSLQDGSTPVLVANKSILQCYCPTTYLNGCASNNQITNVALNSVPALSNASGCASGAYSYFMPSPARVLTAGNAYQLQITMGADNNQYAAAWIDYNQDNQFSASENIGISGNVGSNGTATFNFTVPVTATNGLTRLRIRGGDDYTFMGGAAESCGATQSDFGETEDYDITIQVPSLCTGTPEPGNTTATQTLVCPNTNTTLGFTGSATGGTITYQWQSSPDNITYTNVNGATNPQLTIAPATNTWYQCVVTCNNSGLSDISVPIQVLVNNNNCDCANYCTPVSAGGACITNVTFNTLNNSTGCSSGNYSFQTPTTSVEASVTYPLSVTTNSSAIVSVWIDFNQNNTFEASEWAQVFTTGTTGTAFITIPANASLGTTRMRIRTRFAGGTNGAGNACVFFDSGEAEDYCITIVAPIACSGTPTAGTTLSTVNPVCPGDDFTLSMSNVSIGAGITYQWQSSSDNMTYLDITGATSLTLTTSQTTTTWYQCVVTCTNSMLSANSTPLLVSVVPPLLNDDPCTAITLPVGSSCSFTTFAWCDATATVGVPPPGCASYSTGDVWFKAVVPASGNLVFDSNTGTITNAGMAIYRATDPCDPSTFILVSCNDDDSANGAMPRIDRTGFFALIPNDTIYIRVWDFHDATTGSLQLCVYETCPTWYEDADGDTYGNPAVSVVDCVQPTGYVANFSDCDDTDPDINPTLLWYKDVDNDGYSDGVTTMSCTQPAFFKPADGLIATTGDCNDLNPAINPTTVWYKDFDEDGYSDGTSLVQCAQPIDYQLAVDLIATSGDCDDTNPALNPATVWYKDFDDDGYSDGTTLVQCVQPMHYKLAVDLIATTGDCNDTNPAINPTLVWYKDFDNDGYSDGTTLVQCIQPVNYKPAGELIATSGDCDDANPAINPTTVWYKDFDEDGHSDGTSLVQCAQPVDFELATSLIATSGDCDDTKAFVYPGAPELCDNMIDDDCDGTTDEKTITWTGGGDGTSWINGANWDNNGAVPQACNNVVIPAGSAVNVPAGAHALGQTLQVDTNALLTVNPAAVMTIQQ